MPEIDNLNISISAESKKASTAIDNLIAKLNKLETNLSSLGKANVSGLSGVTSDVAKAVKNLDGLNTATFTRVTNTFKKLSDIDSTNIYVLSSALNGLGTASQGAQNVGDLAKNLSKLGNKGVQNAITNIPQLATAMNQLLTTLSKSPKVSSNIIQMTNALANLASQGQKISVASNAMANGINHYSASARNAKKHTTSLAAAFGKFYASYFLVIRGIKALWGTVETASDYLETLNYFEEAFEQVAKTADLSQWEELGYESAEAYANSFSKRATELTAKMTGFQVLSDGTLQSTGLGSLGINPSDVMQYQAMFGQMSSSMGVASETALKLSDALTMIGADLASVRNMKFEDVWTDMASGLAGMSRTLDKYGVNIRNVNLQQKLNELGIEANIQALNQNEKALLRGIILLENTQYAWGDLAETLNAPANQLRLLSSNMENLSRIIGNLFLPVVQKVLPYINGFVIALQRLFTWIGTTMGIDLSGIMESTGENPLDEIIGGSEELEETLGDSLEASEKLKKSLRGFDELKTISSETASLTTGTDVSLGITGGVLDTAFEQSLAEYQAAWDTAFANMENKAEEFADKIEGYLEPVKKIFEDLKIGDYLKLGEDTSNLVIGIFDFFTKAIESVDWYAVGKGIGDFLAGLDWKGILQSVGKFIWEAINASVDLWKGAFEAEPIATTILTTLFALPALATIVSSVTTILSTIATAFSTVISIFSGLGTVIGTVAGALTGITGVVALFAVGLGVVFATNEDVRKSFNEAITAITDNFEPAVKLVTETILPSFQSGWEKVIGLLTPFVDFLETVFTDVWMEVINPALLYVGETVIPTLIDTFENLWKNVIEPFGNFLVDVFSPAVKIISDVLTILWKNVVIPLSDAVGNILSKVFENLSAIFNKTIVPAISGVINAFDFLWKNILSPIVDFLWKVLKPAFEQSFSSLKEQINGISRSFGGIIDFIGGVFTADWSKAWQGIVDTFGGIWDTIVSVAKAPINLVLGLINGMIDAVESGINSVIGGINKLSFDVPKWVPGIGGEHFGFDLKKVEFDGVPYLANGGIVSRPTLAMIGEAGTEAVVPLENNTEWIKSIAMQINSSSSSDYLLAEQNKLLREQNQLLQGILEKEGITENDVYNATIRQWNIRANAKQANPVQIF